MFNRVCLRDWSRPRHLDYSAQVCALSCDSLTYYLPYLMEKKRSLCIGANLIDLGIGRWPLRAFAKRGNSSHLVADFGFSSQEVSSHLVADFGIFSRRNCTSHYSLLLFLRVLSTRSGVPPLSAHKCSSQQKLRGNKEVFAPVLLLALTFKP